MPCSLLLALGLLTAPECYSSLAEHAPIQWDSHHKQLVTFGKRSPESSNKMQADAIGQVAPAMAEEPEPAGSLVVEPKAEAGVNEMPAIAERAPRIPPPGRNEEKIPSPAIAQKIARVAAPVTEVAPIDLSSIILDSPHPIDHAPAIAERLKKKADVRPNSDEWQQIAQACGRCESTRRGSHGTNRNRVLIKVFIESETPLRHNRDTACIRICGKQNP